MKAACEEMEARGAADEVQHLRYSLRGEIWEQYISESRPSNTKVLTLEDPRSSLGQTCDLIGFYYPNKMTPIDILCEAGFLSNFWETDLEFSLPEGDSLQFQNAEAAFQATKYMERANEFTTLSGEEASHPPEVPGCQYVSDYHKHSRRPAETEQWLVRHYSKPNYDDARCKGTCLCLQCSRHRALLGAVEQPDAWKHSTSSLSGER